MEILAQLFGGSSRVKIMRLFLFNEGKNFSATDIASKTRLAKTTIGRELKALERMGMIKKRDLPKRKPSKTAKKGTVATKKKDTEYTINPRFIYAGPLRQLLSLNDPVAHRDITDKLRKAGKMRLVAITGIFIGRETDRVDILIVGDNVKKNEIDRALLAIESEVGHEIAYAYFDTDDFIYRVTVKDRLIRDILDYPHEKIINRLEELE